MARTTETETVERTVWPIDFATLEAQLDEQFELLYNVFENNEWANWKLEDGTQDVEAIQRLRMLLAANIAQWNSMFRGPFDVMVYKMNHDGSLPKTFIDETGEERNYFIRAENTGLVGRKPKPKPVTAAEKRARFLK